MSEKELVVSLAGNLSWPSSARGVFYPADTEALREDFDCEQEKLFVDDDEIEITIIEIKNGSESIISAGEGVALTAI